MSWTVKVPFSMCEAPNAYDLDRIMRFFAKDCVPELPNGNKPYGSCFEVSTICGKRFRAHRFRSARNAVELDRRVSAATP